MNKLLIYFVVFHSIFGELFVSLCGLPAAIRYLNDLAIVILFVCALPGMIPQCKKLGLMAVVLPLGAYIASLIVGLIINGGNIWLILWASRNSFRGIAFFFSCVVVLEREDVFRILDALYKLRWPNFLLCLIEFFVLHVDQDNLGGMFGTAQGCNGGLNVYLCAVLIYSVCRYLDGRDSFARLFATVSISLVVASMAELKMFYLEVVIIVLGTLVLGFRKGKVVPIFAAVITGGAIGLLIMWKLFPDHLDIITDLEKLFAYGSSGGGGYDLSRLRAFENIDSIFFEGDILKRLFGLGFGNCEYSGFSFLTSEFYLAYGQYHYRWFAHQMMFLETGYVGFFLYVLVLIGILFSSLRTMWRDQKVYWMKKCSVIMSVITIFGLWYNAAIRTEFAYLTFFVLSVAAVCQKQENRNERDDVNEVSTQN